MNTTDDNMNELLPLPDSFDDKEKLYYSIGETSKMFDLPVKKKNKFNT